MNIGALGDLPFYISDKAIQTFNNLEWESSAEYKTHDLHMKKGILELTGFEPDEVKFDLQLSAFLGVNPNKALEKLDRMLNKGIVNQLVIGTRVIGTRWVVTKIGRKFDYVYRDGEVLSFTVSVTLTEYN